MDENRVTKNYSTDGGDTLVIGGKLKVEEGASVEGLPSSPGEKGEKGDTGPQGPAGEKGDKGDSGVGIKTITGAIDGQNKLTLTFTLTDDSQQTVEGTITPAGG